MISSKYSYNKELIKKLGYIDLIKKYNFNNNLYNEVIFFAITSLDYHLLDVKNQNIDTLNILFGDYFSFAYYDKLFVDLDKLIELTKSMEKIYITLAKEELNISTFKFLSCSLAEVLFSFYEEMITEDIRDFLFENFCKVYSNELDFVINSNVQTNKNIIEEI